MKAPHGEVARGVNHGASNKRLHRRRGAAGTPRGPCPGDTGAIARRQRGTGRVVGRRVPLSSPLELSGKSRWLGAKKKTAMKLALLLLCVVAFVSGDVHRRDAKLIQIREVESHGQVGIVLSVQSIAPVR